MITFQNVPRTALPIHIRAYKLDGSEEVVWDTTIEAETFTIPPLEKIHRCPVRVHIQWGNGTEKKILM
jgi:hypothetical protein